MTLYILSYNNYFNRLLKKEETLEDYMNYVVYGPMNNINFVPNDNIDTTQIVGKGDYDGSGDYVLAIKDNVIVSRWFITNATRNLSGQYTLTLHRDLIADYYNIIKETPLFVEKATLLDSDPFIFNPEEGMTFNQIKQKETPIKDKTECSWIVGYIAREKANGDEYAITGSATPIGTADIIVSRDSWEFKDYLTKSFNTNPEAVNFKMNFRNKKGYESEKYLQVSLFKQNSTSTPISTFSRLTPNPNVYINSSVVDYTENSFNSEFEGTYNEILDFIPSASKLEIQDINTAVKFKGLNAAKIKFSGEDTVYQIKITQQNKTFEIPFSATEGVGGSDEVYLKVQPLWKSILTYSNPQHAIASGRFYSYSFTYEELTMSLVPIGSSGEITYNIPIAREHLVDAPYDMICAPYEDTRIKLSDNTVIDCSSSYIQTVFNDIAIKNSGGDSPVLYDIQRLPYCPIFSLEKDAEGIIDATQYSEATQAFKLIKENTNVGVIFSCNISNFYKNVVLEEPIVINNTKIQSSTDVYRLVSPNYNGIFEFDAAMNGGVNSLNIYCSYKPFNPYIQVSPDFGGLYGDNFDDSRGLVCGGEWSLPIVSSAWETYERQNVNYNNIFQRGIENLKVTQKYERLNDIITSGIGTLTGAATGSFAGGWIGANKIAGAGIGAGMALAGGIADVIIKEKLRKENLDYTQDMFTYQMGNIQALPQSLSRTSAFTVNNKIFPFLEYFTCTKEEKEAFAYKIAYNGMTVMRIGLLNEFEPYMTSWTFTTESGKVIRSKGYFKARLVRLTDMDESYHITNAINEELFRGFYIDDSR